MAITTLHNDSKTVQYLGSFERAGILNVYEIDNAGLPSDIYMHLVTESEPSLAMNPLCKVNMETDAAFVARLGQPKVQLSGAFKVNMYALFCNDLADITNIVAHYGHIRVGGLQFSIVDAFAAGSSDYLYQINFYAIDAPVLFQVYKQQLFMYSLVQQLSFDIASYADGRRVAMDVVRLTNLYPKLLVDASLNGNDLLIVCKDTNGVGAVKHVSMALGIAEESISVTCNVKMIALDLQGQRKQVYDVIIANSNYDDAPLHCILPQLVRGVTAVSIQVDYIMSLNTIGETLHFNSGIVLTDGQIGTLHCLSADEVAGGVLTSFYLLSKQNEPIEGVNITINGELQTTGTNGIAEFKLDPGSYTAIIEYSGIVKVIPITVATAQVIQIVFDVVLLDMHIQIIGSDSYNLPNIEMDVSNVMRVTDQEGLIKLRGIEGRIFKVSHQLGETIHKYNVQMQGGKTVKLDLFNTFDDELLFQDELT